MKANSPQRHASQLPQARAFGRCDGRHMHEHFLWSVHIEHLAARAPSEAAAPLAGLPFVRWKFLAGIPQGIFPRGPISLMTPRLEIG